MGGGELPWREARRAGAARSRDMMMMRYETREQGLSVLGRGCGRRGDTVTYSTVCLRCVWNAGSVQFSSSRQLRLRARTAVELDASFVEWDFLNIC